MDIVERQVGFSNDVVRLVVAARRVVESSDWTSGSSPKRMGALDRAVEAFSSRVPYDDQPEDAEIHKPAPSTDLTRAAQAMIDWIGPKDIRVYASDPVVRNLVAALAKCQVDTAALTPPLPLVGE